MVATNIHAMIMYSELNYLKPGKSQTHGIYLNVLEPAQNQFSNNKAIHFIPAGLFDNPKDLCNTYNFTT